jgi:hypothetical protein
MYHHKQRYHYYIIICCYCIVILLYLYCIPVCHWPRSGSDPRGYFTRISITTPIASALKNYDTGITITYNITSHVHSRTRTKQDLRRQTEITPFKIFHTRIKPLDLASGHGRYRYITVTPERTLVSVGEWPLQYILYRWPL